MWSSHEMGVNKIVRQQPKTKGESIINAKVEKIKKEVSKVIVGQEEMIESIIVAIISDGHILLEGYPGLGKTITIKTSNYWQRNLPVRKIIPCTGNTKSHRNFWYIFVTRG